MGGSKNSNQDQFKEFQLRAVQRIPIKGGSIPIKGGSINSNQGRFFDPFFVWISLIRCLFGFL